MTAARIEFAWISLLEADIPAPREGLKAHVSAEVQTTNQLLKTWICGDSIVERQPDSKGQCAIVLRARLPQPFKRFVRLVQIGVNPGDHCGADITLTCARRQIRKDSFGPSSIPGRRLDRRQKRPQQIQIR